MAFNIIFLIGALLSASTIVMCIMMRRTAIKLGSTQKQ
jgi:hypothetical protein